MLSRTANRISLASQAQTPRRRAVQVPQTPAPWPREEREIIDRVGGGIVLITIFDATGRKEGLGSGFIIDKAGHVLTNYHVVEHATKATAQFKDGTECDSRRLFSRRQEARSGRGAIEKTAASANGLVLAHGAEPHQGDDVVAIGHPKGYAFTVTTGIVSAIRSYEDIPDGIREFSDLADDGRWIQTTAPITHGNSGGPLLNAKGEVIGVNSWIMHEEGNLAFACHISVIDDCVAHQTHDAKPFPVPGAKAAVSSLVGDVLQGFMDEYAKYAKQMKGAGSEVERGRMAAKSPVVTYMQRLYSLAQQHRKEKVRARALSSACELSILDKPHAGQALKEVEARLLEDHVEDEKMGDVALRDAQGRAGGCEGFSHKAQRAKPASRGKRLRHVGLGRAPRWTRSLARTRPKRPRS